MPANHILEELRGTAKTTIYSYSIISFRIDFSRGPDDSISCCNVDNEHGLFAVELLDVSETLVSDRVTVRVVEAETVEAGLSGFENFVPTPGC
jgi:hypothetical protein